MKLQAFVFLAVCGSMSAHAALFTVAKDGRGQFRSVQAAIDAAGKNDIVEILDNAIYDEQVTIDSARAGMTLRSKTFDRASRPRIRFSDTLHVGPRTFQESQTPEKINFDFNGALRILTTRNITIEGIIVDGARPFARAFGNVWEGKHPHFFGNVGIDIFMSANCVIRYCEITNAYFGFYIKDRNEGGIFANANPADLKPWNVVPLSGFGQSGNHLIERNRIGFNSWAIYFESAWDLSSTIRYNLLYENHHTPEMAAQIASYASIVSYIVNDQPGGAILFRDVALTPMAIYNNTFWNNYTLLYGTWQVGVHHLVFNNLFASPFQYWSKDKLFANPYCIMEPRMVHRVKNCIYEAQHDSARHMTQEYYASAYDQTLGRMVEGRTKITAVSNVELIPEVGPVLKQGMNVPVTLRMSRGDSIVTQFADWVYSQGAPISGEAGRAFPMEAGNRWMEIPFMSTSVVNPNFLTPDWNNESVRKFIKDAGWAQANIRDSDGTPADIGAISSSQQPQSAVRLRPVAPVIISDTTATIQFEVVSNGVAPSNLRIAYCGYLHNVAFPPADISGRQVPPVQPPQFLPLSDRTIVAGGNTLTVKVPRRSDSQLYAFFEMTITGTDGQGRSVTSDVGFFPYRKLDYQFEVKVLDSIGVRALDTVRAGAKVNLMITPVGANGAVFANTIVPAQVSLSSGTPLIDATTAVSVIFPAGITGTTLRQVNFTRVPPGGLEYVAVSGIWKESTQSRAFYGTSDAITVLPGLPAMVSFENPPSQRKTQEPVILDPGSNLEGELRVFDKYGNTVDSPAEVTIGSLSPQIGDIAGGRHVVKTDSAGVGGFTVAITQGQQNQEFRLEASLAAAGADTAQLKVGEPREKLWIFYDDVGEYQDSASIQAEIGTRRLITIWASKNGESALPERTNTVIIQQSDANLTFHADSSSTATVSSIALTEGVGRVWVSSGVPVRNGGISVADNTDPSLLGSARGNITFVRLPAPVVHAWYTDGNADGIVDTAYMVFGRGVTANEFSLRFARETRILGAPLATVIRGDTVLALINAQDTTPKTDGLISVEVLYIDSEIRKSYTLADSAAPVAVEARYMMGLDTDSLLVAFSEPVVFADSIPLMPFVMQAGSSTAYRFALRVLSRPGDREVVFAVDSISDDATVESGHLLRIVPHHVEGTAGKYQVNPENRPVLLQVSYPPVAISCNAAPNPFIPSDASSILRPEVVAALRNDPDIDERTRRTASGIVIVAQAKLPPRSSIRFDADFAIYDALGNMIVSRARAAHGKGKLFMVWDGHNEHGRSVGKGTYLALVEIVVGEARHTHRVRLGVK